MADDECDVRLTNTNGIVTSFYELLWKKKNERQEKQCKFPNFFVYIPDTIVYNFSQPQYWYFTSTFRKIVKKKRQNLNSKNVLDKFLKTKSKSGIRAIYMYKDESPEGRARVRAGGSAVCIKYLNADGLKGNLLRLGQFSGNGVLQQFIDPKPGVDGSCRNNIIQATWQPNHIHFDKRQNKHLLTDERFSYQQRAETFEGTFENSETVPVVSSVLLDEVTTLCNKIAEHMWHVADCTVKRMVLNFRIDESNKVWFLFCSNVAIIDRDTVARSPAELLQAVGPPQRKDPKAEHEFGRSVSKVAHGEDEQLPTAADQGLAAPATGGVGGGTSLPPLPYKAGAISPMAAAAAAAATAIPPTGSSTVSPKRASIRAPLPPPPPASPAGGSIPPIQLVVAGGGGSGAGEGGGTTASTPGVVVLPPARISKHYSYLKETFTDMGWGESAESVKRIVFDFQNFLSPSQR